jgi:hypothetical protein
LPPIHACSTSFDASSPKLNLISVLARQQRNEAAVHRLGSGTPKVGWQVSTTASAVANARPQRLGDDRHSLGRGSDIQKSCQIYRLTLDIPTWTSKITHCDVESRRLPRHSWLPRLNWQCQASAPSNISRVFSRFGARVPHRTLRGG